MYFADSEEPWCVEHERESGGLPDRLQPEDEPSVLDVSPIKTADEVFMWEEECVCVCGRYCMYK